MPTATKLPPSVSTATITPAVQEITVQLRGKDAKVVNRFVEARLAKNAAEKEYAAAKDELRRRFPATPLTKGQRYVGRLKGIVRVVIAPRERTDIDRAVLISAFPEAAAAAARSTVYENITTV